jgi:hypothetical protein
VRSAAEFTTDEFTWLAEVAVHSFQSDSAYPEERRCVAWLIERIEEDT